MISSSDKHNRYSFKIPAARDQKGRIRNTFLSFSNGLIGKISREWKKNLASNGMKNLTMDFNGTIKSNFPFDELNNSYQLWQHSVTPQWTLESLNLLSLALDFNCVHSHANTNPKKQHQKRIRNRQKCQFDMFVNRLLSFKDAKQMNTKQTAMWLHMSGLEKPPKWSYCVFCFRSLQRSLEMSDENLLKR